VKWPRRLIIIRHGESVFNAIKNTKEANPDYQRFRMLYEEDAKNGFSFRPETISLASLLQQRYEPTISDPNCPLTDLGRSQARVTGIQLAIAMPEAIKVPSVIYVSPYRRALETAEGVINGWLALSEARVEKDERISERDIGIQFMYNDWRIFNVFHPMHAKHNALQDRYYAKPLNGESMREVRLRNRQILQRMIRKHAGEVVLLVAHGISILCIRSLLEHWTPEEFIDQEANHLPPNCGVTIYECDPLRNKAGNLKLVTCNKVYY